MFKDMLFISTVVVLGIAMVCTSCTKLEVERETLKTSSGRDSTLTYKMPEHIQVSIEYNDTNKVVVYQIPEHILIETNVTDIYKDEIQYK
jgi:hypothetical protein